MAYKDLGQIAAIVYSTTAPNNKTIMWRDTVNNLTKYYNSNTSSWVSVQSDVAGMVAVSVSDTPDFLDTKLDEDDFEIIDNIVYIKIPVTQLEKDTWNGKSKVYFAQDDTARDALLVSGDLNTGDRVFVYQSGASPLRQIAYTYDGTNLLTDSDVGWANESVEWSDITNGDDSVELLIFNELVGFGSTSKILRSDEMGVIVYEPTTAIIALSQSCEIIKIDVNSSTVPIENITINSAAVPVGKSFIISLGNVATDVDLYDANFTDLSGLLSTGDGTIILLKNTTYLIYKVGDFNYKVVGQLMSSEYLGNNFLSKTNTITYTPTTDYHPSTKKYVDDRITIHTFSPVTHSFANAYESNSDDLYYPTGYTFTNCFHTIKWESSNPSINITDVFTDLDGVDEYIRVGSSMLDGGVSTVGTVVITVSLYKFK